MVNHDKLINIDDQWSTVIPDFGKTIETRTVSLDNPTVLIRTVYNCFRRGQPANVTLQLTAVNPHRLMRGRSQLFVQCVDGNNGGEEHYAFFPDGVGLTEHNLGPEFMNAVSFINGL